MNREIRFRAWNEEEKTMVDLEKITPLALSDGMNTQLSIMGGGGVFIPFLPNFKIMQFTGLKDKNGIDIYEGDVIKDCDDGYSSIVWMFNGWRRSDHDEFDGIEDEVIGNIHENPELLELGK